MKKVIVIGCPGSGKSTFSRALHDVTKIPLYHLDMMYWNADKTTVEKSLFRQRLADTLEKDEWIIDGNYASTMELRLAACDTVIFLDYPLEICLNGIKERRGKPRSDIPWTETEEDAEFIDFIKSYNEQQRPRVFELFEKYKDKNIVVKEVTDCMITFEDVAFLADVQNGEGNEIKIKLTEARDKFAFEKGDNIKISGCSIEENNTQPLTQRNRHQLD